MEKSITKAMTTAMGCLATTVANSITGAIGKVLERTMMPPTEVPASQGLTLATPQQGNMQTCKFKFTEV